MNKFLQKIKNKKGFTLVELLVVISIIGILVAVGATSYQRAVKLSRDSKRKTDLEQIRQALEIYRSETGAYPVGTMPVLVTDLAPDFIATVPVAGPKGGAIDYYTYSGLTTSYSLCAVLMEATTVMPYCVNQP